MPAILVDVHLIGFVLIELLPDGGLVLRGQPGPRLVGTPVVLRAGRHLNIVVEFDDLTGVRTTAFRNCTFPD